jgi:hypothetical protein
LGADRLAGLSPHSVGRSVPGPSPHVALAAFGGPLALAALNAPALVADASSSAGLAMLAAIVVFAAAVAIWLRYTRQVNGPGGPFGSSRGPPGGACAGRDLDRQLHAYLVYTTVPLVYDLLPQVLPRERSYQTLLALLIPIATVGLMIAGGGGSTRRARRNRRRPARVGGNPRRRHTRARDDARLDIPRGRASRPAREGERSDLAPLHLRQPSTVSRGEVIKPARTIRSGLTGAYGLTALVVTLAVAPLAAAPGVLRTNEPGVPPAKASS